MGHQSRFECVGSKPLKASGRSIRLHLVDGTPNGLIIADIVNWTGQVLAAPHGRIAELLRRPESARTGTYLLAGPDPEQSRGLRAYIGEADHVANRLRIHLRAEDWDFERVGIVVAKDDYLTKTHARFLESQLLRIARENGNVSLENSAQPDFQLLPEADREDMDYFLSQLLLVLPLVGFEQFRQVAHPAGNGEALFTFSTAGAEATARETEEGFMVLTGSKARRQGTETFPEGYRALRDQLVRDGMLVEDITPELYRFAEDVAFGSPSAAASVVAARSASGPREWKVKSDGLSYREWRAAQLDE